MWSGEARLNKPSNPELNLSSVLAYVKCRNNIWVEGVIFFDLYIWLANALHCMTEVFVLTEWLLVFFTERNLILRWIWEAQKILMCVTRATYRSLTQTVRVWISIFALASCREPCTQGNGAKALSQSAFQIRVEKISVFQSSHWNFKGVYKR